MMERFEGTNTIKDDMIAVHREGFMLGKLHVYNYIDIIQKLEDNGVDVRQLLKDELATLKTKDRG